MIESPHCISCTHCGLSAAYLFPQVCIKKVLHSSFLVAFKFSYQCIPIQGSERESQLLKKKCQFTLIKDCFDQKSTRRRHTARFKKQTWFSFFLSWKVPSLIIQCTDCDMFIGAAPFLLAYLYSRVRTMSHPTIRTARGLMPDLFSTLFPSFASLNRRLRSAYRRFLRAYLSSLSTNGSEQTALPLCTCFTLPRTLRHHHGFPRADSCPTYLVPTFIICLSRSRS